MKSPIDLEAPGAGLPKWQLTIIKPLFHIISSRLPREKVKALYITERQTIIDIVTPLDPTVASTQTLIPRLAGIEDSSRFWSVYMTLEHLSTVDTGVSGIIKQLCAGCPIDSIVRTENVKPSEDADQTALPTFELLTQKNSSTLNRIDTLDHTTTHPHPWFGPITARQWNFLIAIHLRIHRKQIESILAEQNKDT